MENDQNIEPSGNFRRGRSRSHIWGGLVVLGIGALLLMRQSGVDIPNWVFTWPMLLIVIGIFSGLKERFRGGAWLVMILVGGLFLYDNLVPGINLHRFIWPLILISIGLLIILRPRGCRRWGPDNRHGRWRQGRRFRERMEEWKQGQSSFAGDNPDSYSKEDYLDITSIFGGVKKIVVSKNFKGGDITNFMGGTEVNLTQADIQGTVTIDTTNIFGGAKLVVPASWDVKSEATAIFGGIEDRRDLHSIKTDPNKVLIIDGTCIFGGIEIRNF